MYFPYLFGKQSELLAVREMASAFGDPQKIVPVIEPVGPNGINLLHRDFKKAGKYVYVVENPTRQAFETPAAVRAWRKANAGYFSDKDVVRPAFREHPGTTATDIADFVAAHPDRAIAVIMTTGRIAPADLKAALAGATGKVLVFMEPGANRVGYVGELGVGITVEINHRFTKQRINADYSGTEWFTNDHVDFGTSGYPGFSDYTVLPTEPNKDGGGRPGAVAIHLSYRSGNEVWVQHFVSDETDRDEGDAGSKLLEAIAHLATQAKATPTRFDGSPIVTEYLRMGSTISPTSLGGNKKLEIKHHLYIATRLLGI